MKTYAIIALLGVATVSHALMLDDFSTGDINDKIFSGSNIVQTAATVPGGFRTVYHAIEGNPLSLSHSVVVINGVLASDSKTQVDAFTLVGYGFDGAGAATNDLNADLTSQSSFRLNFVSNDLDATVRMRVNSGGVAYYTDYKSLLPDMVLMNQSVDFDYSEFGAANFTDIDQISFEINTTSSGDTVIDSFEAVPEPASMIALGLGVAALISRKRKA
jgi:hypothetical protein